MSGAIKLVVQCIVLRLSAVVIGVRHRLNSSWTRAVWLVAGGTLGDERRAGIAGCTTVGELREMAEGDR